MSESYIWQRDITSQPGKDGLIDQERGKERHVSQEKASRATEGIPCLDGEWQEAARCLLVN